MSENYAANPNNFDKPGADQPHAMRYLIASGFVDKDDIVYDCACGYGYGSKLLAKKAKFVYAFDKNRIFNDEEKIKFINANVLDDDFRFYDYPRCNTLVSLETIEHFDNPEKFLAKVINASEPDKIVISSPNIKTAGANPFHLTDVLLDDLIRLMKRFPFYTLYGHVLQGDYYVAFFVKKGYKFL